VKTEGAKEMIKNPDKISRIFHEVLLLLFWPYTRLCVQAKIAIFGH
jgi:hypothetical protein